jgi:hypothetical protein
VSGERFHPVGVSRPRPATSTWCRSCSPDDLPTGSRRQKRIPDLHTIEIPPVLKVFAVENAAHRPLSGADDQSIPDGH